jgi:hypothetical protein
MNLVLLKTKAGETYPILERVSRPSMAFHEGSGRWHRLKVRLYHSYQSLRDRLDYEERVCDSLRHLEYLDIYHGCQDSSEEAEKRFRAFLRLRYSKHSRWLWVDGFLALLGTLLTPLPGPNIFFFYPAVRSMGHYLARKGARNAMELERITFRQDPLIDLVQGRLENLESIQTTVQELCNRYRIENLEAVLKILREK